MVAPRPAGGHIALRHPSHRAAHPDRRVDVGDPDDDGRDRPVAVDEFRDALRLDAGRLAKIDLQDDEAGEEERGHEQRHRPEHEFLPGVEPPDLGNTFLLVAQNAHDRAHPGDIVPVPEIVAPELHDESGIAHEQHAADPRMDRALPLPASEYVGKKKQGWLEHRQAGQHQQDEARRRDPMIDPRRRRIANDSPRRIAHAVSPVILWPDARTPVAWPSDSRMSFAAAMSSSGATSFGPAVIQWKNPLTAASATPAIASGF